MSANITFDGAPESGVIDFGVGQPSADLLPFELVRAASERFFAQRQPIELNYGEKPGDARFRTALAEFLTRRAGGHAATADSLFLTAGTSQALDFVCQRFTRPGDIVFVEEPSYFLAFQIFRDHGLEIVGIPLDGQGMDVDALERELARRRPKLVYTIPSFDNPTGQTLSDERRERLVALERRARFSDRRRRGLPAAALRGRRRRRRSGPGRTAATCSRWARSRRSSRPACGSAGSRPTPLMSGTCSQAGPSSAAACFNHFGSHVVRQMLEDGSLAELLAESAPGVRRARRCDGRGAASAPRRHRELAETRGRLFLLADAAARSGYRAPARGRALSRDRLPAGLEVLGHRRHAQLPAAELRVLRRTGNPRRRRALRQGAAGDRSLTPMRAGSLQRPAASRQRGSPRRRLRFYQSAAVRIPART